MDPRAAIADALRVPDPPRSAAALPSLLVLAGYTLVAWAVGSFYPFSVFPMYAGTPGTGSAARLAARTAGGDVVEVTTFRAFDCDREVDPDTFAAACGDAYAPRYLDDELSHHVRAHARSVAGGERVEIVWRRWELAASGEISTSDCVVARCEAER